MGHSLTSLIEQIETTTSGGALIFYVFDALAEFERDLIRERTQPGLAAAGVRGRLGGRPKKLDSEAKVTMARALYADHSRSIADICKTLGISRATLSRYLDLSHPGQACAGTEPLLCCGKESEYYLRNGDSDGAEIAMRGLREALDPSRPAQ